MKKWVLKALIQKFISFLPYKHKINYLFQKYVTKGVQLSTHYFEDRLIHLKHHIQFYEKYKGQLLGLSTLELGTGWYPVIPVGLFLSGADQICTVDISELMDKTKILQTVERYLKYYREDRFKEFNFLEERMVVLEQLSKDGAQLNRSEILERLGIKYLIEDARSLSLQDGTINLITSNNTFEHVYPDILKGILVEFSRILKSDGLMSHFIDMSDHFAHLDQSITIYNFLQFSNAQWDWIDNTIQPQNRWRINHFRGLYADLKIPISEELNRPGSLEDLARIKVHPEFKQYPESDLAISHSYVISAY